MIDVPKFNEHCKFSFIFLNEEERYSEDETKKEQGFALIFDIICGTSGSRWS